MKNAVRVKDMTTGHDCAPPSPIKTGSNNVIVNGRQTALSGISQIFPHSCPNSKSHDSLLENKPPVTVYVNGIRPAAITDKVLCGGVVMTGSSNVFFDAR